MLFAERIVLALRGRIPFRDPSGSSCAICTIKPFVCRGGPERAPFLDAMWALLRSHSVTPRVVIESRSTVTRLSPWWRAGVGDDFHSSPIRRPRPRKSWSSPFRILKIEAKGYLAWRHEDELSFTAIAIALARCHARLGAQRAFTGGLDERGCRAAA